MALSLLELFLITAAVLVGSFAGTASMRWLALRYGWLAHPRENRWHRAPTALHGGVGFVPVFLICAVWLVSRLVSDSDFSTLTGEVKLATGFLAGSVVMFTIGILDDFFQFRPATKLLWQVFATSVFITAGGVFHVTGVELLDTAVTYFWFIGIMNAVNMLDNMDGLCSGIAIISTLTCVLLALQNGQATLGLVFGALLVAAISGFWLHNKPPASIFMGDAGSLFIGFAIAALAMPSALNGGMSSDSPKSGLQGIMALLIPATILAMPIFDTTLVTVTRLWRGRRISEGGRDHSSHRLVGLGLSERRAVWILYGFALAGGLLALLMQRLPEQALVLFGFYLLLLLFTGVYLGRLRTTKEEQAPPSPQWTPLVSDLLFKRHAAELLLDTVLILICFYSAYLLRFGGDLPEAARHALYLELPLMVTTGLFGTFVFRIYLGYWRFITLADLPRYVGGVLLGAALADSVSSVSGYAGSGHSQAAFLIFTVVFFVCLVGSRLSVRLLDLLILGTRRSGGPAERQPILIYGAGRGGKLLCEEMLSSGDFGNYRPIGFIDDDERLAGSSFYGLPVRHAADWAAQSWEVAPHIWVSSPRISQDQAQRIAAHWEGNATVHRFRWTLERIPEHGHDRRGPKEDRRRADHYIGSPVGHARSMTSPIHPQHHSKRLV